MALQDLPSDCQAIERSEFTAQTFHTSNTLEACNALLAVLDAPEAVRRLIPALLGLMAGRVSVVRFTRYQLAERLYGGPVDMPEADRKRLASRVSDLLATMQMWLDENDLANLIDYQPGSKDQPNRIQSPILKWVAQIARKADALPAQAPDYERRRWFRSQAQAIIKDRLQKAVTRRRRRPGRVVNPQVVRKQILGMVKLYAKLNSSRFVIDGEDDMSKLVNDIKAVFENQWCVKTGRRMAQNVTDQDANLTLKEENTWCLNSALNGDDEEEREHREEGDGGLGDGIEVDEELEGFEGDTWADGVVEESGPIPPPCVPSLPDPVEDHSRELASLVRGRSGAHWQALDAVLSTGAIPTRLLLGGNGDPGYTGEVGDVQEIYRLGVELDDCGPRKKVRAITWPSFLAGGFNRFIARSHDERLSTIVQFKIGSIFQIDDLTLAEAELLKDHSCLIVETSPGSFQAWVKIPAEQDNENGRRAYAARWKELGVKAGNRGSTHSGRWPGSINAKPSRGGWEVSIWWLSPGRRSSLEAIGATMPAKVPATAQRSTKSDSGPTKGTSRAAFDAQAVWAEATRRKGSDRSTAHASFGKVAYHAGLSINEIVDYLIDYSTKAQANGREWTEKDVRRIVAKYAEGGAR